MEFVRCNLCSIDAHILQNLYLLNGMRRPIPWGVVNKLRRTVADYRTCFDIGLYSHVIIFI